MKVLVCGGRTFANVHWLNAALNKIHAQTPITRIIHGGAKGADTLAGQWAQEHGIECAVYPAAWDMLGKAAGVLRNQAMLDSEKPDLVLAFPGKNGTKDMVARSMAEGYRVEYP